MFERLKSIDLSGWATVVFLFVVFGIPAYIYQWLVRPRAMVEWHRQGGGWPSPAEIEPKRSSDTNSETERFDNE